MWSRVTHRQATLFATAVPIANEGNAVGWRFRRSLDLPIIGNPTLGS